MLPSWATSLLSSEVLEKLLSLVDQDGQVALVDLVRSSSAFQEIGESLDLGRQNGDLNLTTACVGTSTLDFLRVGAGVLEKNGLGDRRLRRQLLVGLVAAKSVDAALDVDTKTIFRRAVGQ